jgi:hypothetical protein
MRAERCEVRPQCSWKRAGTIADALRDRLGQSAELAALHVETLDLGRGRAVRLDLERGVLLLLEQEHALEDAVEVNLEQSVLVVDELLERVGDHHRFLVVRDVRVDEDRVGVTVDDLAGRGRACVRQLSDTTADTL